MFSITKTETNIEMIGFSSLQCMVLCPVSILLVLYFINVPIFNVPAPSSTLAEAASVIYEAVAVCLFVCFLITWEQVLRSPSNFQGSSRVPGDIFKCKNWGKSLGVGLR